ncbi:expressed unknown protein [Seminavis robusta]|uniref:Uncharacterized protein n=1 Tax=Seminavis robusta TaxID=568900 RepID=A0A9N8D8U5_9STRA|nr:expressed unknown protein [Seminavis robusta]|eukprot:Sro39_g024020.1 n/a (1166) ;mRNA; f:35172-39478
MKSGRHSRKRAQTGQSADGCWRSRHGQRRLGWLVGTFSLLASESNAYSTVSTKPGLFGSPRSGNNWRPPRKQNGQEKRPSIRVPSVLRMVLTTPESIIEQASTQKLLDILIDESVRTTARRPIMMQFDPSSGWIWRRWKGTVFSETWISCVRNVVYALVVLYIYRAVPRLHDALTGFSTLWAQLLSVTTFTLTFFVNQSYALWRKCYEYSRRLQGRLHDIDMTLAAHAARKMPASPSEASTYTSASRQLLDLTARYVRLFNLLTYASFTRSHRPILTPRGMRRLVERGLMTSQELEVLVEANIPATQRHNCVLMWIARVFVEGKKANHFEGGSGMEQQFMEKIHVLRAQYGAIGDELQGRMPLAYAHIVQVLVDCVLLMYPLMAFSSGMSPILGVLGTGLLTTSYQGLFDLAKQFLDPYDNENYGRGEDPLCVDTLIAESNAGSIRWMYGFEQMPVSSQRIRDGELYDYLLPVRGYTVEELDKMEQERLQKEKELKEMREREEAERIQREEAERLEQEKQLEEAEEEEEPEEEVTVQSFHEDDDGQRSELNDDINETATGMQQLDTESFAREFPVFETDDSNISQPSSPSDRLNATGTALSTNATTSESTAQEDLSSSVHKVTSLGSGIPVSMSDDVDVDDAMNVTGAYMDDPNDAEEISHVDDASVPRNDSSSETSSIPVNGDLEDDNVIASVPVSTKANGEGVDDDSASESLQHMGDADDEVGGIDHEQEMQEIEMADDVDIYVPEMVEFDFESLKELPWFDEVGPDGQEVRLSQMLAEEEWESEESLAAEAILSKEELLEVAESERRETELIMSGSPQAEAMAMASSDKSAALPGYDQTKLDGISQLWGLQPGELDLPGPSISSDVLPERNDFDEVSQLWGQDIKPSTAGENPSVVGYSDSWGGTTENGGPEKLASDSSRATSTYSPTSDDTEMYGGNIQNEEEAYDFAAYGVMDWDEDGGQGDRLSQILADETWESYDEPLTKGPIKTLEDYTKKVVEILEAAEDELLETEAILRAPPGADSVAIMEREGEDELVLQTINETRPADLPEFTDEEEEDTLGYDDLEALSMDVVEQVVNTTDANATGNYPGELSIEDTIDASSNTTHPNPAAAYLAELGATAQECNDDDEEPCIIFNETELSSSNVSRIADDESDGTGDPWGE